MWLIAVYVDSADLRREDPLLVFDMVGDGALEHAVVREGLYDELVAHDVHGHLAAEVGHPLLRISLDELQHLQEEDSWDYNQYLYLF